MRAEENRAIDRKLDRFARADAVLEKSRAGEFEPENTDTPAVEHQRVIRDSFSLPANDYAIIAALRERALKAGVQANKSELVRAGLRMLQEMRDADFLSAVQKIEKIKTGRPADKNRHTI
jgi:Arc/MetJ-type ribon-helix-helix transcriptional regulator